MSGKAGSDAGTRPALQGDMAPRLASALVMAAAALALTWIGGLPFRLLAAAGAALVFYEWITMAGGHWRRSTLALVALAATMAAMVAGAEARTLLALLGVAVAAVGITGFAAWRDLNPASALAYAGLPAIALTLLRGSDAPGLLALLFLFAAVWATDIGAYFCGRSFGGPKLAPAISPGKTWSGAVGGALIGCAAGVAAGWAGGLSPTIALAAGAAALSVVSQFGDLFESAVKRRFGAKDSGRLIPGHGGLMDRIDGLVAAAVVLCAFGALWGGLDQPAGALFRP